MAKKFLKLYFKKTLFVLGTSVISLVPLFSLIKHSENENQVSYKIENNTSNSNLVNARNTKSYSLGFSYPPDNYPNPEWPVPFQYNVSTTDQFSTSLHERRDFNFQQPIDMSYCLTPENKIENILDFNPDSLYWLVAKHFQNHQDQSPYAWTNYLTTGPTGQDEPIEVVKKRLLLEFVNIDLQRGELVIRAHWKASQISFRQEAWDENVPLDLIREPWNWESGQWATPHYISPFGGPHDDGYRTSIWITPDATFKITGFRPILDEKPFKVTVNTQYDVSNKYSELLPTDFMGDAQKKAELEQEIIKNNVETIINVKNFYQGFNPQGGNDVVTDNPIGFNKNNNVCTPTLISKNWRYTSSNGDPYNVSGSLYFDLKFKNFFDNLGNWVGEEGKVFTITVTGFKSQTATTMEPVVDLPIEFSNIFAQFAYENPQLNSSLLNHIIYTNSPLENDRTNFFIKNDQTTISPDRGELVAHIGARAWYNQNGILITDNPNDWIVTFRGFRRVPGETIIKVEAGSSIITNNENLDVNNVSINDLKNIIFNNIKNKPDGFSTDNILIKSTEIIRDSSRGEIKVSPSLSLYYDSNLFLRKNADEYIPKQVTIKGFKTAILRPTRLPTESLRVRDVENIAPYQAIDSIPSKEKMKIELIKNSYNLPPNFSTNNVIFTSLRNVDLDGYVMASGYINYFYDNDLNLINPNQGRRLEFNNVSFLGFKPISPTIINKQINLPNGLVDNISVQNVNEDLIKEIMNDNLSLFISNLPNEFNLNRNLLDLRIIAKNALKGKVVIQFNLNSFFELSNESINYINGTKKLFSGDVEINNFKTITPTKLVTPFTIPSDMSNIVPSTLSANDIKNSIVYPYIKNMFVGLPSDFTLSNINDVVLVSANNARGEIVVNLKINRYYSSSGELVMSPKMFNGLTINGFRSISPTIIKTSVSLTQSYYREILPQNISSENIKSIIDFDKNIFFENIPENLEVVSSRVNSYNNTNGSLNATVAIRNYYDGDNSFVNSSINTYELNIGGFKNIQPTKIIDTLDVSHDNQYSSSLVENVFSSQDSIKDFILFYKNQLFQNLPENFLYENINVLEITQNNLEGSAFIEIEINYYYKNNESGELVRVNFGSRNTLKKKVKVSGFKNSLATNILDSFIIPDNLYNNILPSEVTEKELSNIIWVFRNSIIENLPSTFSPNDIYFDFSYVFANNLTGSINVSVELYKYYDAKTGLLVNPDFGRVNPLTKNIVISGFKNVDGKTTIASSIDASTLFPNNIVPKPSDLNIEQIIQMLLSANAISNVPKNFSIENIRIKESSIILDNINGNLSFIVSINNFYDSNGDWSNKPNVWMDFPVTITNLAQQLPTKILNVIEFSEFNNVKASYLSETQILGILRNNSFSLITNPTPTFKPENISSFKIIGSPNNKLGQINGTITIDDFYNNDGFKNKPGETLTQDVILLGFETLGRTYANDIITLEGFENRLPSSVTSQEIVERIYANKELIYSNLPNGVLNSDLVISIDDKLNQEGVVKVSIKLLRYYDASGTLVVTENKDMALNSSITIKGFKKTSPTSIIDSFNVLGFHNTLPSEVDSSILYEYIWNNRQLFIESIPENFTKQNLQISLGRPDNKNGSLFVNISLSSYYDSNSQLIVDSPKMLSKEITLFGFKKIQPTTIIGSLYLTGYSDILINNINDESLKDVVYRNRNSIFFNTVGDTISLDDFDVSISNRNNKTGSITAQINLYKYYDQNGNIPPSSFPLSKTIEISGFKQISPSLIPSIVSIKDSSSPSILKNPYDYISSPDSSRLLRELIINLKDSIFINMPENFNIDENFTDVYAPNTENVNANAKGELKVYITFNNYYDEQSNFQSTPTTRSITITGFNKVYPTTVNKLINNDNLNLSQKLPQFITKDDLRQFLISKIHANNVFYNIPESFNENSISDVKIISYNNLNGTINAKISIKDFYDSNGILITNSSLDTNVTFNGFLCAKPTKINGSIIENDKNIVIPIGNENIEPNSFENMTQEQINEQLKILTKNANDLVSNLIVLPNNKTTRIEILNYVNQTYNNQNGTIQVVGKVYNFIDANGKFIGGSSQDSTLDEGVTVRFEISGYKIKNSFNYTENNKPFKYTLYAIFGVVGAAFIGSVIFFALRYKKIRGLK